MSEISEGLPSQPKILSRRNFLKLAGVTGLAALATSVTACGPDGTPLPAPEPSPTNNPNVEKPEGEEIPYLNPEFSQGYLKSGDKIIPMPIVQLDHRYINEIIADPQGKLEFQLIKGKTEGDLTSFDYTNPLSTRTFSRDELIELLGTQKQVLGTTHKHSMVDINEKQETVDLPVCNIPLLPPGPEYSELSAMLAERAIYAFPLTTGPDEKANMLITEYAPDTSVNHAYELIQVESVYNYFQPPQPSQPAQP